MIDGVDVRDLAIADLRAQIGIVLAGDVPLHGARSPRTSPTAKPDATLEEIIRAAKAANAHDFIIKLPDGYDTVIGERGHDLSGGEKQRISIARAILHNPRILILDEATASAGHRDGAADPGGARSGCQGPHHHRHRPPPLDAAQRRPPHRHRKGRGGGDGHPRGAGGACRASTTGCGKSSRRRWPSGASRADREAVCGAERGQLRRALGPLRGRPATIHTRTVRGCRTKPRTTGFRTTSTYGTSIRPRPAFSETPGGFVRLTIGEDEMYPARRALPGVSLLVPGPVHLRAGHGRQRDRDDQGPAGV